MQTALTVLSIIGYLISVLTFYQIPLYILGVFHVKKYRPTENKHKYAICISARNEEKVIKNLLESIKIQDYPAELIDVFVVADNCTDSTAKIVRDFAKPYSNSKEIGGGIYCYEHNNPEERTKGFALKFLFDKIKEDFGIDYYEAYFIFDADNVLKPDYISRMNEAFDEGNKIVTSFRNSKNTTQNWISWSYAIHWLRTCLFHNRAKDLFRMSCKIQGTGFMFSNEVVKDGWKYTNLLEDRSFACDLTADGYTIAYCEAAEFYDEQPYNIKVAFRQRLRWSKGFILVALNYTPKLVKSIYSYNKNTPAAYDMFWISFPSVLERAARKIIRFILGLIVAISTYKTLGFLWSTVLGYLTSLGTLCLKYYFMQVVLLIVYRKKIGKLPFFKTLFSILLFPTFTLIGRITTYIALFKKVEWKPIPHDYVIDVNKLNEK